MRIKVGFTGTQIGMSEDQINQLTSLLIRLNPSWFHHGDCIGADAEAHEVALKLGIKIAIHPPRDNKKRAYCKGWKKRYYPEPYLDRDRLIVKETDLLIGAPKSNTEEIRSGTWYTIRYARRIQKPMLILIP